MVALSSQIILVTGANRGIGFSIVLQTALRKPSAVYILACRSVPSGKTAIKELKGQGVKAVLDVVELDITVDSSITAATEYVKEKYGRLDVLVNNAGLGVRPKSTSPADIRSNFAETFNANIASIYVTTCLFQPLLHRSEAPKVINISSGRASLTRSSTGNMPPTQVVAYSVSKAGLNSLNIEMQKTEDALGREVGSDGEENVGRGKTEFFAATPGHCKTAFNGFRGTKDPNDGAEVAVRLALAEEGEYKKGGFWELEEGVMREVPW